MNPTRVVALAVSVVALLLAAAAPAGAQSAGFQSENVQAIGKLPDAAGAIGAHFSPDGNLMYVTGATGLGIYDVSQPAAPTLVGRMALPHFENEDVDVGDGVVVITNDPGFTLAGFIYIIDVSDPSKPAVKSIIRSGIAGLVDVPGTNGSTTLNGHISNCIGPKCGWIYTTGTSEGLAIYDIRDRANPKFVNTFAMPTPKNRDSPGFTHDVFVDAKGIAWVTGEDGIFGYDVGDPVNPKLLYRSDENLVNSGNSGPSNPDEAETGRLDFLYHNSMRLPDDYMAVTEEDYTRPGCNGQGSFQTLKITKERNSDGTIKLEPRGFFVTELNELLEQQGRSPATVNCSAHWFDYSKGLIAQGWYDQGVRFLDVRKPDTPVQVGFYATSGTFWAAYFAPRDKTKSIVYALDVTSGIDILRIDRGTLKKVRAPARVPQNRSAGFTPSDKFRYACPLLRV
jgi:hypothetical protein